MWSVWRITGRDPYCIYHGLRDDYTEIGGGDPFPPPFPSRLHGMLYAFGDFEFETVAQLAGAKVTEQRERPPREATT